MDPTGIESLERLQSLHRDLVNLNQSKLPNIERLLSELEARVEDFRNLLDKTPKNDKSRQALLSGTLQVGDLEYQINEDFKQETIQLADFLDLDEVDAAKLYLQAQADAPGLDRSPLASAVIIFHQRRQFLLECIRLSFKAVAGPEDEGTCYLYDPIPLDEESPMHELVTLVLQNKEGRSQKEASYWRKCLASMGDIEKWLQQITERVQSMAVTGQVLTSEYAEILELQTESLAKQHESLAAIAYHLARAGYTSADEFRNLLPKLKTMDRYDALLVHYLPTLMCSISIWSQVLEEHAPAQELILGTRESESWSLRSFHAAVKVFWLATVSRTSEEPDLVDSRSAAFMEALRDGAFHFILSVNRDIKSDVWFDPLRHGITTFLTQDTPSLQSEPFRVEKYLHDILVRVFRSFVEEYISNMPDTIRKLKFEEDEQRRQTYGVVQLNSAEYDLHLERFLIIIAYAYEGFPEAAKEFWADLSNTKGFLQWASQRQSTPRVAAFCEMLRALSEDTNCADLAHSFLVNDGLSAGGRTRRNSPLSWSHIFGEIEFYSSTIRDRPVLQQGKTQTELVEPESAMMLECYLRLLSHMCKTSDKARNWILTHTTFHVREHLLLLCGSSIESRLRACALSALAALLAGREREARDAMWSALDAWTSGSSSSPSNMSKQIPFTSYSTLNEQIIFEALANGFEEPNAFVQLIQALTLPTNDDGGLSDSLPFPESLGSAYRMPGIEPYVDFVLGVFATKSFELQDPIQLRIIRWTCLNFAATCLSTFNADLVVFANASNISVDTAIRTSSLATYARIHPFARVMEWAFNEKVVAALFSAAIQDIKDVNNAQAHSPLILGLVRSIQFIDLVMTLQSTYFDIVRPLVKLQSPSRRPTVANSALASFDEAILNNINIVSSLALYCGSGHQDLTLCSIRLLQRLSASRKLTAPLTGPNRALSAKSRLITALERNEESERISRSLVSEMRLDVGEIEQGASSPGIIIKETLLQFIRNCQEALTDRPTIAHLLLGFSCGSNRLSVQNDGLFANGASLFHAIVKILIECPFGDAETFISWLTSMKNEGTQILAGLWKSPLSSHIVLPELRVHEFLFNQWLQQPALDANTLWDGKSVQDADFLRAESATAFAKFLQQRRALFDYAAIELRAASMAGMATLKLRIQSAMLGSLSFPAGPQLPCLTVFDMVDFLKFDLSDDVPLPETRHFKIADLNICRIEESMPARYDVPIAQQLLLLRQKELQRSGQLPAPEDERQMEVDGQRLVQYLLANNNRAEILAAAASTLESWTKLVVVILETGNFEDVQRNSFIFQGLNLILPRLERALAEDMITAIILADLGRIFIQHADTKILSGPSVAHDVGSDRLFQLFRVGLVGIQCPDATAKLRQTCYLICHEYLVHIARSTNASWLSKQALYSIKAVGERLVEVVCDDAYAGEGACRLSALLLLGAIVARSNEQGHKEIMESLTRLNYVQIVVDNTRNIAMDLEESNDTAPILSFYSANLALLLLISQTRSGATQVMNAGLFASIRESGLFSADPDVGLDVENPQALTAYFNLLLAIIRIINAVVLSRGNQNDQTIAYAQNFLQEYRLGIMAIFKRSARIGLVGDLSRGPGENEEILQELVDGFTVLIEASGFLDTEQETSKHVGPKQVFS